MDRITWRTCALRVIARVFTWLAKVPHLAPLGWAAALAQAFVDGGVS